MEELSKKMQDVITCNVDSVKSISVGFANLR